MFICPAVGRGAGQRSAVGAATMGSNHNRKGSTG